MLRYETPLEYGLIMRSIPIINPFPEPPIEVIEVIAKSSRDPSFKKKKFFRYLEEYRKNGVCCKRGKKITPELEAYYKSIRDKKLELYIERNKRRINKLKKEYGKK